MRNEKGQFIKGYKPIWSKKSRLKVSESTKGKNTWSKGRKLTEEHKKKCRENSARYWLGKKRPNMTGVLHPNWKVIKKSPLYLAIRGSQKYLDWRLKIKKKHKFHCQFCGAIDNLQVDHYPKRFIDFIHDFNIKSFEEAMECDELWKLDIARTLCIKCHRQTPNWGKHYL
jgi:hypothetical protein